MRTIYKTLMLGVFLAALAVVSPTFAQDDVCADVDAVNALYKKYNDNRKGTLDQKKVALEAGKEFLGKYKDCAQYVEQIEWLKKNSENLAKTVVDEEFAIARDKRYERFNKAIKSNNGPEIFASGEDILKFEPDFLDVIIVLADAGLDEAVKNNETYTGKTVKYAKDAIKRIEDGEKSKDWGALDRSFSNKDNALGWLNYTIGYVEFFRQKQVESGLDYFYKSSQLNSGAKDQDLIYAVVGDNYRDKALALNAEIAKIIETEEKETFESKSKLALSKGYVERAIDAYSRAYDVRKANLQKEKDAKVKVKIQASIDELYETLKSLYKFRYETIEAPIPDAELPQKLNSHIASVTKSAFQSPKTEVQPVDPPSPDEETPEGDASTSATGGNSTTVPSPTPKPAASKTTTTGASVKSDADKTNNKPKN